MEIIATRLAGISGQLKDPNVGAFAVVMLAILFLLQFAAVVLGYVLAMRAVYRDFKGISGDLLGYLLVIGVLFGLVSLALLEGSEVRIWF